MPFHFVALSTFVRVFLAAHDFMTYASHRGTLDIYPIEVSKRIVTLREIGQL
ncbi:hypothetical protein Pla144_16280 [Bythopirellula polymerisocia]|uniref:Uncharacterized protein n=1 Tax=Bythopirellula polymerisocia TaxID=2528003 RepID=A0A5C6CUU3_9BACT|nr:hypothetical protein Pla144_16280 [Bythopirellula polymerisocia]